MSTIDQSKLTPMTPHLVLAFVSWLGENGLRPYITFHESSVDSPLLRRHLKGDYLTLNVSVNSVKDLVIGTERITFNTRFGGAAAPVNLPTVGVVRVWSPDATEYSFIMPTQPELGGKSKEPSAPVETKITELKKDSKRPSFLKLVE